MSNLVQIVNDVSTIEEKLIQSEGQLTPEIEALLVINSEMLPAKIDNYSLVLERFDSLAEYYSKRAKFFSQISKQCEAVQERLKENIKTAMKTLETDEIKGHDIRFKLQRTKPSVVIVDEKLIPKEYKKEIITYQIEKERLKSDLEIGVVPGAKLEESFSLRAYANLTKKGKKDE